MFNPFLYHTKSCSEIHKKDDEILQFFSTVNQLSVQNRVTLTLEMKFALDQERHRLMI